MTLLQIKAAAAAYHNVTVDQLTSNGVDLGLLALNQAKREAELEHDFNFQRKMLSLSINNVTGGVLDDAVVLETTTTVDIKTILDIGILDKYNNFNPVEWTTAEESQERERQENRYRYPRYRYPTDAQYHECEWGQFRVLLRGNQVSTYPAWQPSIGQTLNLGIDAYVFDDEWTDLDQVVVTQSSVAGVNDTYTQNGQAYGYPVYISASGLFFLYYDGTQWILTGNQNDATNSFSLVRDGNAPDGTYAHNGNYTGTAMVVSSTSVLTPTFTDIWTTHAAKYLLWATVIDLNKIFKSFVPRQEGNVAEPADLMAAGLQAFIDWDVFKYEQGRRHGR